MRTSVSRLSRRRFCLRESSASFSASTAAPGEEANVAQYDVINQRMNSPDFFKQTQEPGKVQEMYSRDRLNSLNVREFPGIESSPFDPDNPHRLTPDMIAKLANVDWEQVRQQFSLSDKVIRGH